MMPQKNLLLFTDHPIFLCSISRKLGSGAAQEQMHLRTSPFSLCEEDDNTGNV